MRVEIFTTTGMEISHFAPIVRALLKMDVDARFVQTQTTEKARAYGWDDAVRIEMTLKELALPFVNKPDYDADVVLTIQNEPFVRLYNSLKMRLMYGVGLVPPAEPRCDGMPFDYHLVHGPLGERIQFSAHALASPNLPPERVKVIGYPRFDDWFIEHSWVQLEPKRPVLLWLPTWGRASSIDRFADAIFALEQKYDIWVKPHHGTVTWERERMLRLAQSNARIIDYTDHPEESFAAASVVLADLASGAFSEAMFLGKPVVGLSNEDDVQRVIMTPFGVPLITHPSYLRVDFAGENLSDTDFIRYLFTSTHGHDGERAAKIIVECAKGA